MEAPKTQFALIRHRKENDADLNEWSVTLHPSWEDAVKTVTDGGCEESELISTHLREGSAYGFWTWRRRSNFEAFRIRPVVDGRFKFEVDGFMTLAELRGETDDSD